jgi:uncharacterized protein YjdB
MLTAVSPGAVTVSATAQDGSGVEGTMQVTITEQVIMVSSVSVISEGGATSVEEGGALQFSVEVLPENATNNTVTWSVENGTGSATITPSGLLTAVSPGTVTVSATAQDGSGVSGEFELQITEIQTSINPAPTTDPLIYPNPSTGLFFINTNGHDIKYVQVINVDGSIIFDLIPDPALSIITINPGFLKDGTYIVRMEGQHGVGVQRILIAR